MAKRRIPHEWRVLRSCIGETGYTHFNGRGSPPRYLVAVRAFGYLTAVVLAVIGIGIGLLAATSSAGLDNVSGRFVTEGGPYPGLTMPNSGKVIFIGATGRTYTTSSGSNGRWAIDVPPGSYAVTGIDRGGWHCPGGNGIGVRVSASGSITKVMIVCPIV